MLHYMISLNYKKKLKYYDCNFIDLVVIKEFIYKNNNNKKQ